ncbi:MAG: lipase family protein [Lentisphaeraceae bacterium]|nr:lipase family protein [Lentisphaeraceae bacterium]
MDNFLIDYSKKAIFQPGTSVVFEGFRSSWKGLKYLSTSALLDWWAVNLCILSYRDEENILADIEPHGELIKSWHVRTQYAYLCKIGEVKFLVIQGSSSFEDNILDAKFLKKYADDGEAYHRGFLLASEYLLKEMKQDEDLFRDKDVIFSGHSLGGAIAQILSTKLSCHSLITFGAPKVGKGLSKLPESVDYRRYVNCSDAVPLLPPNLTGFDHSGKVCFIDHHQDLQSIESHKSRFIASMSYFLSFRWCLLRNGITRSLVDHSPINYSRALSRYLIQNELEK